MKSVNLPFQKKVLAEVSNPEDYCIEEGISHQRLAQILQAEDIRFLDLLDTFKQSAREKNIQLFNQQDRHWNENGHTLAAQSVLDFLIEGNYFE